MRARRSGGHLPAGAGQGRIGAAQIAWLEERLAEVAQQPRRLALLASHHGSASLDHTRGAAGDGNVRLPLQR